MHIIFSLTLVSKLLFDLKGLIDAVSSEQLVRGVSATRTLCGIYPGGELRCGSCVTPEVANSGVTPEVANSGKLILRTKGGSSFLS